MSSNLFQPFVSIIIPVYNGQSCVEKCIQAVLEQDYPRDKYEIIIIDNGSIDQTLDIINKYPVIVLQENVIHTSYAARNKGVIIAKGEILAFTDADCVPKSNWVSQGVGCFSNPNVAMVGGKICFSFSSKKTAAEMLDSLINLHNESSILHKSAAKTANLFVRREIFEAIGLFRLDQKSGEDIAWTGRASRVGYKIIFCHNAIVVHPARSIIQLLKKHFRVGTGSVEVWKSQGRGSIWIIIRWCSLFLPLLSIRIPHLVKKRGDKELVYPIIKMMGIVWLCTIATACGILLSNHVSGFSTNTKGLI